MTFTGVGIEFISLAAVSEAIFPWECNRILERWLCARWGENESLESGKWWRSASLRSNTIYNLFCGFPALLHCDSNSVFHGIAKHQRRDTIPSSDGWSGCFTSAEILSDARTSNCGLVVLWCGNRTLRYFILTAAMVKDFVQQQKYYCWSGIEREHQWGCDKLEKRAPHPRFSPNGTARPVLLIYLVAMYNVAIGLQLKITRQ